MRRGRASVVAAMRSDRQNRWQSYLEDVVQRRAAVLERNLDVGKCLFDLSLDTLTEYRLLLSRIPSA